MTKRTPKNLTKAAALSFDEWVGLQSGRIRTLSFHRATINRVGTRFVMAGPSGQHSIEMSESDLERTNAHWTNFATHSANLWG